MNSTFHDPIVAEVRKNREDLLAEFDGDIDKLRQNLDELRTGWKAAGFHYVTEEERHARLAWRKQQDEELARRIASL
jgi:hypothetical protein